MKAGYIANISEKISALIFKGEAIGVTLFRYCYMVMFIGVGRRNRD